MGRVAVHPTGVFFQKEVLSRLPSPGGRVGLAPKRGEKGAMSQLPGRMCRAKSRGDAVDEIRRRKGDREEMELVDDIINAREETLHGLLGIG